MVDLTEIKGGEKVFNELVNRLKASTRAGTTAERATGFIRTVRSARKVRDKHKHRKFKKKRKRQGATGAGWDLFLHGTPEQKISASLETPAIGGGAGVIKRVGGTALAFGAGVIASALFGGGVDQTQSGEQETNVDPTQTTAQDQYAGAYQDIAARVTAMEDLWASQDVGPIEPYIAGETHIEAGGDVWYTGPVTETTTITGLSQEAFSGVMNYLAQLQQQQATPTQTVTVTPSQQFEQSATTSSWLLPLLIVGAVVLFMGRTKKKKAKK
jgi:hypothetical protein